jgi:hypothetical protein
MKYLWSGLDGSEGRGVIEWSAHSKSANIKLFQAVLITTFSSSLFSKFM